LDAILIYLGAGCLVCLMPLAVYLLYLSHLNGRATPALVPGPWDFGAVLLALSGFILLLGPLMITLVDSQWRARAYGNWASLKSIGKGEAIAGSLMATGYVVVLATVIPLLLRARRRVTAIYNVAATSVESSLIAVLEDLGFPWRRNQGQIEIGVKKTAEPPEPAARFFPHETATVRIDAFPSVGHASLKWGGAWSEVRSEVEPILERVLTPLATTRNPVAGWMFTTAVVIMIVMLLWLVVLIYLIMTPPPG
jgi:hypothetical protein